MMEDDRSKDMRHKKAAAGLMLLCAGIALAGCADKKEAPPEISFGDISQDAPDDIAPDAPESSQDAATSSVPVQEGADDGIQTAPAQEAAGSAQADGAQQDLYAQFLDGKIPLTIAESYPQDGYKTFNPAPGDTYTLAELGQYVDESYFTPGFSEGTSHDYEQYARIACPDSGRQVLLLKFYGLDIYGPEDDSFGVFVIMEKDGQLYLTDGYECWARSYTEAYSNGLIESSGSNGAGDHEVGTSVIMSDGTITDIHETEILTGWWAGSIAETIYSEIFDENEEVFVSVLIHTIDGQKYYTYDMSECTDDQKSLCETYFDRCRDELGISWLTDAEVDAMEQERCAALGIDPALPEQKEKVVWADI